MKVFNDFCLLLITVTDSDSHPDSQNDNFKITVTDSGSRYDSECYVCVITVTFSDSQSDNLSDNCAA